MQRQLLSALPRALHNSCLRRAHHLLHHIQRSQCVRLLLLRHLREKIHMLIAYILDMAQPVLHQSRLDIIQSCLHTATAKMPDYQQMFHFQVVYRILHDRQRIQIRRHYDIGDIAVYKHLSRLQTGNLVCRHARIGTAYPHILRILLFLQPGKKSRSLTLHIRSPVTVMLEQVFEFF